MPLDAQVPLFHGERLKELLLCYAGPWAFGPYLRRCEDHDLHWHARQGVLLAFVEVAVSLALLISGLLPILGPLALHLALPFWLLWCLTVSVTAVLQASKGKRFRIPVLHQFVDHV